MIFWFSWQILSPMCCMYVRFFVICWNFFNVKCELRVPSWFVKDRLTWTQRKSRHLLIGQISLCVQSSKYLWGVPLLLKAHSQLQFCCGTFHVSTSPKVHFTWSSQAGAAFCKFEEGFLLYSSSVDAWHILPIYCRGWHFWFWDGCGVVPKACGRSPAEQHYDIVDQDLFASKIALEESRHWLECSSLPFIVCMNLKNLEYLKTAKKRNARQAHWAFFFARFNFT